MEALADEVGRMLTTLAIRLRNPTAQGLPLTRLPSTLVPKVGFEPTRACGSAVFESPHARPVASRLNLESAITGRLSTVLTPYEGVS